MLLVATMTENLQLTSACQLTRILRQMSQMHPAGLLLWGGSNPKHPVGLHAAQHLHLRRRHLHMSACCSTL